MQQTFQVLQSVSKYAHDIPTTSSSRSLQTQQETHICETTDGVKGYSGYVNLPAAPAEGRNYPQHTWFWSVLSSISDLSIID